MKSKLTKNLKVVKNKVEKTTADLFLIGDIEDYEYVETDVTPQKILNALKEMENISTINMFCNSCGGSVIAGIAIANLLTKHKNENNVKIVAELGFVASMGTAVPMSADWIKMHSNGIFMVHKPVRGVMGNANDMIKQAQVLDVFESGLIAMYMTRFKGTRDELEELMANETWLTPEEALEYGFIDEIIEPMELVAKADSVKYGGQIFSNEKIVNKFKPTKLESEEKELKYSNSLEKEYGISQETFEAFTDIKDLVSLITAKANADVDVEIEKTKALSIGDKASFVKALEVEDISSEEILALAIKGKEFTEDVKAKLEKYDNIKADYDVIVNAKIDEALKMANIAMGVNFDETVWKTALSTMNYQDIVTAEKGWRNQANSLVNAGNRVSEIDKPVNNKGEKIVYTDRKGE